MIHFHQDHLQILHHEVDRGHRLYLLRHHHLRYDKGGSQCGEMDSSSDNVEAKFLYSFRISNRGRKI
jgi:hypothetical protein